MKGKIADGEARERLIIWLRRRMDEFGITLEALAQSIQHDIDHPPLYRDARGNEWNGVGDMPDWLRAARNAGVNPDFFRIEARPAPHPAAQTGEIDPRQLDLFF
ncbi:H-NS histone family protein (plasmid) [Paraburkholderia sprentiae WSM5005]|uniref:H-NS histone family protein n=2 Tax=Paraburkholderia sprentiae TaxID=948107 RepID=A0ACA8AXE9_9BURK|nr:H-NS histone family protein [Paraburkholderia sprentiae WSM5005]